MLNSDRGTLQMHFMIYWRQKELQVLKLKEVYEAAVKKVMKESNKQTFEGNLPTGGAKKKFQ